jgi:organic hydroperoxide reductase OsmC/OhrA
MHPYPHLYVVSASGQPTGTVPVSSPQLVEISTAPPAEFGGPGDLWSPETLLCASVADCFILTFRAVARAAKLSWTELSCRVDGTLDRAEGVTSFVSYVTHATLTIADPDDADKARQLLEKAEHGCLIANSLSGTRELVAEIVVAPAAAS